MITIKMRKKYFEVEVKALVAKNQSKRDTKEEIGDAILSISSQIHKIKVNIK